MRTLEPRFLAHAPRHPGLTWEAVEARLDEHPAALWSLMELERTGGEPDVVGKAGKGGALTFMDCSAESPAGRRSVCYDEEARTARKTAPPKASALGLAHAMGVELLDEAGYRQLQTTGELDRKTSSWILTPPAIRALGGALFMDRRYDHLFVYHNGAESYYAARGFRCRLVI